MKGYKGFGPGLVCRGKQYAENTVFEEERAEICESGMHFCKNPLDVLYHYPLIDDEGNVVEVAEVEALDEVKTDNEKRFCTKKLKIGAKLSLAGFIEASFDFLFEHTKNKRVKDSSQLAASGTSSQLNASGDDSKLAASGRHSVLMCAGANSKAKAKIGCWITLSEWEWINNEYVPVCVKTEKVDGKRIKEDVFYELIKGEFVERK